MISRPSRPLLSNAPERGPTEEVRLMAATWEREHRFAREAFDSAAAAGLTGLRVAAEDGGLGLGPVAFARVTEEIASVDMGAAFILTVHNNLAASVATSVSAAVRDRYLPDLGCRKQGWCLRVDRARRRQRCCCYHHRRGDGRRRLGHRWRQGLGHQRS